MSQQDEDLEQLEKTITGTKVCTLPWYPIASMSCNILACRMWLALCLPP